MGSKKQPHVSEEEQEGKIPVLTVLKNHTILKNIFIVNKPPQPPSLSSSPSPSEDILLVGRHPDCDLILTHPSISRFHLQIQSKPSQQNLSVIDLSSVHGTWVSGMKLEPGVGVEMKEGDTLKIGVSSRVYRLHWIPISRAYDLENPFLSQLDVVAEEEEGEEEERVQKLNCCGVEMEEIQEVDSILECISSLFHDENLEVTVEKEIPAASPMSKEIISFSSEEGRKSPTKDDTFEVLSNPFGFKTSHLSMTSGGENNMCVSTDQVVTVEKQIPSAPPMPDNISSFWCEGEMESQSNILPSNPFESVVESVAECDRIISSKYLPVVEAVQGTQMQQFYTPPDTFTSLSPSGPEASFEEHWSCLLTSTDPTSYDEEKSTAEDIIPTESEFGCTFKDKETVRDILTSGNAVFNSENMYSPLMEVTPNTKCQQIKDVEEVAVDSLFDGEIVKDIANKYSAFNSENMYSSFMEVTPNTRYLQIKDVGEVAVDSLFDGEIVKDIANESSGGICPVEHSQRVNSPMPHGAVLKVTKEKQTLQSDMEITERCMSNGNIWLRRGKASSAPQIRTNKSILKIAANVDTEIAMRNKRNITNKSVSKNLFSVLDDEEEEDEVYTPDKENFSPNTLRLRLLKNKGKLEEIKYSKSQRSRNSKDNFCPEIYPNENTSSKENQKDIINATISKDLFSVFDEEKEEEIFTPDKENFSPNNLELRLQKKKGNKHFKAQCSQDSKNNDFIANIYPDENISPTSNKENQTPKVAHEHKSERKPFGNNVKLPLGQDTLALKIRVERVPFQPLQAAGGENRSGSSCPFSATKMIDLTNCGQILDKRAIPHPSNISEERNRSWDMVVDTASLLNSESRKALQLLQGLKGTRLIIPRLVIRELDSMKRQFSIFRRISEASLALEWIEECMVKTNWWIHIQSSMEEGMLIAPTPPAYPQTQFHEENWTFQQPISSQKCSMEIASPTVEDHILDFALLYRRKQKGRKVILLSEDVTLKIKCMAEGLLCEPVNEFRESLMNPFSERFLWTTSSPRGQTWSCQDDVVLREKYCRLPMRKSSKASGLKLILLHNSQYVYGQ